MNNLFHSAILKLTLSYLVIVMAISLIFSGVVYHVATDEVARGLRNQTARIYQQYPVFSNNPFFVKGNDISTSSSHILRNLIYLNLVVLAGAGITSYWLAKRTLQPIQEANEQQKQFVADASHELRTPVTALKMESEVALMDKGADAQSLRAALASNLEEASKLETLLNNLLRLSRLESDELEQTFTNVPASSVLNTAIENTKRASEAKKINIKVEAPEGIELFGQEDSLVQLLVILLDNAIKYSPASSTITVTAARRTGEAVISVKDHGVGIEPAALEHVFDRFYRAEKSRTTNGYGLGLAIAKHIADIHHGTITIKSTVKKGTTAIVTLPDQLALANN